MKNINAILTALLLAGSGWCAHAQTTEIHSLPGLNRSIPDGNPAGLSDVRTISSSIVNISVLRVRLHVAGEFNGDLYGYVTHNNALCVLLNRPGRTVGNQAGYDDAGLDVTFDGAAANGDIHLYRGVTLPSDGSPLTGSWQPDGRKTDPGSVLDTSPRDTSLSAFNGMDANGEWTLFLVDMESGGTNMLVSWELDVVGAVAPQVVWASPADISFGMPLGAGQLNATALYGGNNVPGTFVYSPSAGVILNAGANQTLSVTFTPSDLASFVPVTKTVTLTVLQAATTATLASLKNPAKPGESVAFTFTPSAVAPGAGTPTGIVQFKTNGLNAGTATLSGGMATFTTSFAVAGTYAIAADYAGDNNFTGSSATLTPDQAINTPPVAGADTIERYPTNGVKVALSTLLANDTDADGDSISLVSMSATSANGGTVTVSGKWVFYTPAPGWTNADTFTYVIADTRGGTATGMVTVAIKLDLAPSTNLTVTDLGNGQYQLRFHGIPGRAYTIQFSPSLEAPDWQYLHTDTADSLGAYKYIDTPPQGTPLRFYRSVYQ